MRSIEIQQVGIKLHMDNQIKPTQSLNKIIKNKKLKAFADKAAAILPKGYVICVYIDKIPLLNSPETSEAPDHGRAILSKIKNTMGFDLEIGCTNEDSGQSRDEQTSNIKAVLDLTSYSISEYIEAENARKVIGSETLSKYRELALLHRSIVELNNSLRLKDVIHALVNECMNSNLPAQAGAVCLPEECGFTIYDHFGDSGCDLFADLIKSPLFTNVISGLRGEIINDVSTDPRCNDGFGDIIKSLLIMPIPSPNACEGALILTSIKKNSFKAAHLKHVSTLSSVAGISISNAYNFESIRVLMDALLKALAEAIDARDPFTAGHSDRVAHIAVAFAQIINSDTDKYAGKNFSDDQLREIFYSGILHDIGKIGIKEEVLTKNTRLPMRVLELIGMRLKLYGISNQNSWEDNYNRLRRINLSLNPCQDDLDFINSLGKIEFNINGSRIQILQPEEMKSLMVKRGNLTPEERMEIERHPAESQRILEHIPFHDEFSQLLTIIRQHHERLDGSGYPDGVKDGDIILQSRILAIADIFDAITQERHYKPATPRESALSILAEEAESGKLDKDLVELFTKNIDAIEDGMDSIKLDKPSSTRFCKIPRFTARNGT